MKIYSMEKKYTWNTKSILRYKKFPADTNSILRYEKYLSIQKVSYATKNIIRYKTFQDDSKRFKKYFDNTKSISTYFILKYFINNKSIDFKKSWKRLCVAFIVFITSHIALILKSIHRSAAIIKSYKTILKLRASNVNFYTVNFDRFKCDDDDDDNNGVCDRRQRGVDIRL